MARLSLVSACWPSCIEKKLAGRRYWTVNCLPSFPREGGSFCVFVDADTGEAVHVFTGW